MQLKKTTAEDNTVYEYVFEKEDFKYKSLLSLLTSLAREKRIIHFGCIDNKTTTIERKAAAKNWLHGRLCSAAQRCHGVDHHRDGINFIRNTLKYNDNSIFDLTDKNDEKRFTDLLQNHEWDAIFLPTLLSQNDNFSTILHHLIRLCSGHIRLFAVAAPNALSLETHRAAREQREILRHNQEICFTPATLSRSLQQAGLTVNYLRMCKNGPIDWRPFSGKRFLQKNPLLRNDILCIASLP